MNYFISGAIVGAVGDIALQIADLNGFGNTGLKNYFRMEPRPYRVLQASMLTSFWSGAYYSIFKSDLGFLTWTGLVDVLYRFGYPILFPSLKEYYLKNSVGATILYNVISGGLVILTKKIIFK